MNVQIKYQKELEKLEKENRELRQQYLIMKTNRKTTIRKKIKVNQSTYLKTFNPIKTRQIFGSKHFFL